MFIYKITNTINNKIYIGYDTGKVAENRRWNYHRKNYKYDKKKVLYLAMKKHGIEHFLFEVIEEVDINEHLIDKEIFYINLFQSFKKEVGYNRTLGGDGGDTFTNRDEDYQNLTRAKMKESAIKRWENIDLDSKKDLLKGLNNERWKDTTEAERKELTKHLFTAENIKKRSESLTQFYNSNPDIKKEKGKGIKKWQKENIEKLKETNKINGAKGAAKVSKKLVVDKEDGTMLHFNSKIEFRRITGQWANTVIQKTKQGKFHNGYKAREV